VREFLILGVVRHVFQPVELIDRAGVVVRAHGIAFFAGENGVIHLNARDRQYFPNFIPECERHG
jgi:hypothetical protein